MNTYIFQLQNNYENIQYNTLLSLYNLIQTNKYIENEPYKAIQ